MNQPHHAHGNGKTVSHNRAFVGWQGVYFVSRARNIYDHVLLACDSRRFRAQEGLLEQGI
jgi:hypothetical protein